MARNLGNLIQNHFKMGLITEATGLNYPPGAAIATENCIFTVKESVTRRPAFNFESGFVAQPVIPPVVPPPGLPLDNLPLPNAAYSLRQLLTAYVGPVVKLFRASDSTSQDFYPTASVGGQNYVSAGAIQTWAQAAGGNGDSWVLQFYDQTGNGNTLLGSAGEGLGMTAGGVWENPGTTIPTLAGAVITPFSFGDQQYTSTTTFANSTSAGTYYVVANKYNGQLGSDSNTNSFTDIPGMMSLYNNGGGYPGIVFGFDGNPSNYPGPSFIGTRYLNTGPVDNYATVDYSIGKTGVFAMRFNTADTAPITKVYVNGGTPGTSSATTASAATTKLIILDTGAGDGFSGNFMEMIIYNQELTLAEFNQLGVNMAEFYATGWTTSVE
jgi:hypothetical protein